VTGELIKIKNDLTLTPIPLASQLQRTSIGNFVSSKEIYDRTLAPTVMRCERVIRQILEEAASVHVDFVFIRSIVGGFHVFYDNGFHYEVSLEALKPIETNHTEKALVEIVDRLDTLLEIRLDRQDIAAMSECLSARSRESLLLLKRFL
jgi:hypothetical protein